MGVVPVNIGCGVVPVANEADMFTTVMGHVLAVGIGLSLGLIGGGGSILAVPILVYVMGVGAKVAIAMSLVIVGTVSLVGAIPHGLQGNVNLKMALVFTPAAMVGAYLGARLTALPSITETIQLICFGVVMVITSVLMIQKSKTEMVDAALIIEEQGASSIQHYGWIIPLEGLGVGVLTGFVGVGGGFLIIPALVLVGGIPMKEAIGTSLVIIAAKSGTGFLGYIHQVTVDWALVGSLTVAASLGTLVGSYLTRFINDEDLQTGFGYFVFLVAIFVLIRH